MKKLLVFIFISILVGCGGISVINRGTSGLYTQEFLTKIERAKYTYSRGQSETALKELDLIKEDKLLPSERAMKRNLIGVIHFSSGNFEQAIYEFNVALTTSSLDQKLSAQINLNLGSSYYKLGDLEKTLSSLMLSDYKFLDKKDFKNFHLLRYEVAKEQGRSKLSVESLLWLLKGKRDLHTLKSDEKFGELVAQYFSLDQSERLRLVKNFSDEQDLVTGYLTYLEVEHLFATAKKDEAEDLAEWVQDEFDDTPEILELALSFQSRLENVAVLNQFSIGVVLPLTGKKAKFGKRALEGIDFAVRSYNKEMSSKDDFRPIKMFIADSQGSSIVGKSKIIELIEGKNVSLIIGGLFSQEATAEYSVAKRLGTFFISLAQVYMEKNAKNHLLVEVPGSVESQVSLLFKENFREKFGGKGAIIYPDTDRGRSYVEEFWRLGQQTNSEIVNIHKYDTKSTDHRDTVQKLLGLKFKRERLEELELLKEVHQLEGATSIRRIQTLKPEIDFDWVFIPSYPSDALQIIPSFSYFDAFNIPLIGGASWRSKNVLRQSYKLGKLYFVDSNVPNKGSDFVDNFERVNGNKPRLMEILGFDAFKVASNILRTGTFENRLEMEKSLISGIGLEGITGRWNLEDNHWIKSMNLMSLYRGKTLRESLEEKAE